MPYRPGFSRRASIFFARFSTRAPLVSRFRRVAFVEPLEIVIEALVGGLNERLQLTPREITVLVVDRLDARAVNRQKLASKQIEPFDSTVNWRNTDLKALQFAARKSAIVLKSCFSVRIS